MQILKAPTADTAAAEADLRDAVAALLAEIREGGEPAALAIAERLDGWRGSPVLSPEKKARLIAEVPEADRADIRFAHDQVRRFAEAQAASLREIEIAPMPGLRVGQRVIPVASAGAYVPGGRYAHAASAIMSVATAKAAGVPFVVAASPPRGGAIAPHVAYALEVAGADMVLELGGVQAVAAMAMGLFGAPPADILVGPGNAYVAEAKRQLFGPVGIDMVAGPTESAVIADATADPDLVAIDLASQAEHGPTSPVWLFATDRALAEAVMARMPGIAADWPSAAVVAEAWEAHGEVILCEGREEAVAVSDGYAPEHLQVIADDLPWWLERLSAYGSLFLGPGSTVAQGDKCSGTNHILPTGRAARHTGGLNALKFLKVLTWQELTGEASAEISRVAARISRMEGMEGHARACDLRAGPRPEAAE